MADLSVDEIAQRALALEILTPSQARRRLELPRHPKCRPEPVPYGASAPRAPDQVSGGTARLGRDIRLFLRKYKVSIPLGRTFARVFRAVHSETGKTAAVKVLRSRYSSDAEAVNLFEREAELGMQLRHPNIVCIHGYYSEDNTHYIVMDFIEGQTLRQYLSLHKKIEYKIATRIVSDICMGLDYAFKRSHLHRDMKMTNVLISTSGKALLLDFGLAADADSKNEQRNQRAIEYAALERCTGVRRDDKRSDIYFWDDVLPNALGIAHSGMSRNEPSAQQRPFPQGQTIRQVMPRIPAALAYCRQIYVARPGEKIPVPCRDAGRPSACNTKTRTARHLRGSRVENPSASSLSLVQHAKKTSDLPVVCVVESNINLQDSFRNAMKNAGYRVLIFSTVERLLERFASDRVNVDCVLINAHSLGKKAVLGFNELTKIPAAEEVPAILLLDENQLKWGAKTARSRWRTTVGMPITMGRIIFIINKLLAEKAAQKKHEEIASPKSAARIAEKAPEAKAPAVPSPHTPPTPPAAPAESAPSAAMPDTPLPETVTHRSEGDLFDKQIERSADIIVARLEESLIEPRPESWSKPPLSDPVQIETYPDGEEFFFDYVDDRDL